MSAWFVAALVTACGSGAHVTGGETAGDSNASTTHGDSVTIAGSGFGAAPTFAFLGGSGGQIESTAAGSGWSAAGPWLHPGVDGQFPAAPFIGYDDDTRGRVLRATYDAAGRYNLAVAHDHGAGYGSGASVMISWWLRFTTLGPDFPPEADDRGGTAVAAGADAWQHKLVRFRNNYDVSDDAADGDGYIAHWDNEDGSFVEIAGAFEYVNGAGSTDAGGDRLTRAYGQSWYRVDWLLSLSDIAAGRSRLWVYDEGTGQRVAVSTLSGIRFLDGVRQFRYAVIQNYLGNTDAGNSFDGTQIALDDCYVQTGSFKRVEMTDSASLESSTWREIQPHTSWTDSSITVSLNRGGRGTGARYLHVVETNMTTGEDTSLASREIQVR